MVVGDLYSKRKKRLERAGQPDVYQYDRLPDPFRVQVAHIWSAAIGRYVNRSYSYNFTPEPQSNKYWRLVSNQMRREKGVFQLVAQPENPEHECIAYLMEADTDGALDIIEFSFRVIDSVVRSDRVGPDPQQGPDDAISELNYRFREHGVGYQYSNGMIMRVDSKFIHAEAVQPTLALLGEAGFLGPNEEFMKAFEHYRNGRNKEAVAEALKAFESTMKAICAARSWPHQPNATAKPLLDLLFQKGLIPAELQGHFGAFRAAMESGLPSLSNKTSRHGQGPEPKPVPQHFAAHALHLCAANIVFLVEAHKASF